MWLLRYALHKSGAYDHRFQRHEPPPLGVRPRPPLVVGQRPLAIILEQRAGEHRLQLLPLFPPVQPEDPQGPERYRPHPPPPRPPPHHTPPPGPPPPRGEAPPHPHHHPPPPPGRGPSMTTAIKKEKPAAMVAATNAIRVNVSFCTRRCASFCAVAI